MIEVMVPIDPVFEGQVAENVSRLRDVNLSYGIPEWLSNLLLPATLVGHRFSPDAGGQVF